MGGFLKNQWAANSAPSSDTHTQKTAVTYARKMQEMYIHSYGIYLRCRSASAVRLDMFAYINAQTPNIAQSLPSGQTVWLAQSHAPSLYIYSVWDG